MDKIREVKQQISSQLDSSVNIVVIPELFLDEIYSKSFHTSSYSRSEYRRNYPLFPTILKTIHLTKTTMTPF